MNEHTKTSVLYRPVGAAELALIAESDFKRFPPRLPEQPIFYPVLTESYAIQIARDWNTGEAAGVGYVTRFSVDAEYLSRYSVQQAGNKSHLEYWIPSDELERFNDHIVGPIEVIHEFHRGQA